MWHIWTAYHLDAETGVVQGRSRSIAVETLGETLADVEGIGGIYDEQDQAAMGMSPAYGQLVVEAEPG